MKSCITNLLLSGFIALSIAPAGGAEQKARDLTDLDGDGVTGVAAMVSEHERPPAPSILLTTGRLLIDRSHLQNFNVAGFADFLTSQGWMVDEEYMGPITHSMLSSYDIFLIPTRLNVGISEFSDSEVAAITAYVGAGGGVWVFHEYNTDPTGINSLASHFGVTFNDDMVTDPVDNKAGYMCWPNIHVQAHQVAQRVADYGYYGGCCINVTPPSTALGSGGMNASSSSCPSSPSVLAIASGEGRVVFSGDNTPLHTLYYPYRLSEDEQYLLQDVVNWLDRSGRLIVDLDIKPQSCPNPLNLKPFEDCPENAKWKKGGILPAAVIGNGDFDVTEIDVATILLEGVVPLKYDYEDVTAPVIDGRECECTDAGPDGNMDLTLKFETAEIAAVLGWVVHGDSIGLTLTGQLFDGTMFKGRDCVIIRHGDEEPPEQPSSGDDEVVLGRPVPNPFNPSTRISYTLHRETFVTLSVYDVTGRLVERLVANVQSAGDYVIDWDARGMTSGVYFCRIQVGGFAETHKMMVIK